MATTISGDLIFNVRRVLDIAIEDARHRNRVRYGVNTYTPDALAAYVIAVAAVEAFLNETFFGPFAKLTIKDSPLWKLNVDWLERLELREKLILLPQLSFGRSLQHGEQPLQDMMMLVKARNAIVHYRMSSEPPPYVKDLLQRNVLLKHPSDSAPISVAARFELL